MNAHPIRPTSILRCDPPHILYFETVFAPQSPEALSDVGIGRQSEPFNKISDRYTGLLRDLAQAPTASDVVTIRMTRVPDSRSAPGAVACSSGSAGSLFFRYWG